jgi:hypothetical protein
VYFINLYDNRAMTPAEIVLRRGKGSHMWVAHACNPSYSGGRDQEDCTSKPAWANSFWDPTSKKPITHTHKRARVLAQDVGPEFKPQKWRKKKKTRGKRKNDGRDDLIKVHCKHIYKCHNEIPCTTDTC